jgi:rhodanese-related sulfurtransferase
MNELEVPTVTIEGVPYPLPEGLVVLDVREPHEWAEGHIAGAIHMPLGDLMERRGELDPDSQTLVVCHIGGRSARATAYLVSNGHKAVNLDGGMAAWEDAGRPIAT